MEYEPSPVRKSRTPSEKALVALAVLAAIVSLKYAQAFFVPVLAGFFLAYILAPVARCLEFVRVPRAVGSTLAVVMFMSLVAGIGGTVWGQTVRVVEALPAAVQRFVEDYRSAAADSGHALGKFEAAKAAIDGLMQPAESAPAPAAPVVQTKAGSSQRAVVVVATPPPPAPTAGASDWVLRGGATVMGSLATLFTVCLLALFILASQTDLRAKLIALLDDQRRSAQFWSGVIQEIDVAVQRYLGSLVITNGLLGIATGAALWWLDAQDAYVWGVLAALLHFVPYVGPLLTAVGVLFSEFGATGNLQNALIAMAVTLVIAVVIGNFVQTWAMGRVAHMNTAILFVAMLFFTWLWGPIGLLLSVPLTVILKVVCDRSPALRRFGTFLDA